MRVHHIALVCRSEKNADRFYRDLLGLEKTRSYTVSEALSKGLFGFDCVYQALVYSRNDVTFEVFVVEDARKVHPRLDHVGLEVEDQKRFLNKCGEMQVQVIEAPKEGRVITMVKDFDGNLFEIKEKT